MENLMHSTAKGLWTSVCHILDSLHPFAVILSGPFVHLTKSVLVKSGTDAWGEV